MRLPPSSEREDWLVLQDTLHVAGDPAAEAIDDAQRWATALTFDAQGLGAQLGAVDGIWMRWVPPGAFTMGDDHGIPAERPAHRVELSVGVWLGATPITRGTWGQAERPRLAFAGVSWVEANQWIGAVAARAGLPLRLPTEVEWEHACRAGRTRSRADLPDREPAPWCPDPFGWTGVPTGPRVPDFEPVRTRPPNPFGLYAMLGGVREWCYDQHLRRYETLPPSQALDVPVLKGGGWPDESVEAHAAARFSGHPTTRIDGVGFRLALGEASLAAQRALDKTGRLSPPQTLMRTFNSDGSPSGLAPPVEAPPVEADGLFARLRRSLRRRRDREA